MKKFRFLIAALLIFMCAGLQSANAQMFKKSYAWMNGSLVFSAEEKSDHILFIGGSCHEGGYSFVLKKTQKPTEFIVDCTEENREFGYVPFGKVGDKAVYINDVKNRRKFLVAYHNGIAVDLLFPFEDVGLYEQICRDMQSQLNGEYVDKNGAKYIFDYSTCSLGNEVPQMTKFTFGEEYDTPINVIKVANKAYFFFFTTEGLELYNAKYDSESDEYSKGSLYATLMHIDKGEGRWPFTAIQIINPAMLSNYSKKDLRLMRNEILARKGYNFTSPDLQKYFSSKFWYKPAKDNSSIETTIDEDIALNLIISAENRKDD